MTKTATAKKPGTGLITSGLFLSALALFIVIAMAMMGMVAGGIVWPMFILGIILAGIGFARRVLAALENR